MLEGLKSNWESFRGILGNFSGKFALTLPALKHIKAINLLPSRNPMAFVSMLLAAPAKASHPSPACVRWPPPAHAWRPVRKSHIAQKSPNFFLMEVSNGKILEKSSNSMEKFPASHVWLAFGIKLLCLKVSVVIALRLAFTCARSAAGKLRSWKNCLICAFMQVRIWVLNGDIMVINQPTISNNRD